MWITLHSGPMQVCNSRTPFTTPGFLNRDGDHLSFEALLEPALSSSRRLGHTMLSAHLGKKCFTSPTTDLKSLHFSPAVCQIKIFISDKRQSPSMTFPRLRHSSRMVRLQVWRAQVFVEVVLNTTKADFWFYPKSGAVLLTTVAENALSSFLDENVRISEFLQQWAQGSVSWPTDKNISLKKILENIKAPHSLK